MSEQIVSTLKVALSGITEKIEIRKNFPTVTVRVENLVEAAKRLRELGYDKLLMVSGIDEPKENRIRLVYHVEKSSEPGNIVALETLLPRDNPRAPSLTRVWPAALLQEREEYEMLGIIFENHPDLRRILLRHDWPQGVYPLRKDYRVPDEPFMAKKPSKPLWELKPELKPKEEGREK